MSTLGDDPQVLLNQVAHLPGVGVVVRDVVLPMSDSTSGMSMRGCPR
jgi:hypothetical protein